MQRKRARFAGAGLLVAAVAALVAAATAVGANDNAAKISQATITGGTATYTDAAAKVFAKSGGKLTLAVTGSNIACVTANGAADATAPFEFDYTAGSGDGAVPIQVLAFSKANQGRCVGNADDSRSTAYVLDNSGPVVTAALTPAANGAGWNNRNVDIAWTASDGAGSGATGDPAADTVTAETAGVTKTASADDRLGNVGRGSVTVKLDKGQPTISASTSPAPNGKGWNKSDVEVRFTCEDGLSGIKSCAAPQTLSTQGADQIVSGSATDIAGNEQSAQAKVSIDKTAPSLSGEPTSAPNGSGWYNGDVSIRWTCADGLSGIVGECPAASTISGEGTGLTAEATVSDKAGNTQTATSSPAVKIDRVAPLTNAVAPDRWNNTDVNVKLVPTDGLSGVVGTYYTIDDGPQQRYDETDTGGIPFSLEGSYKLEYWSVDVAGNVETPHTVTVKIDKTSPTISHVLSPKPNVLGWSNSDVTVHFDCADATSGIASCTDDVVVAEEGTHVVDGSAVDNAGNSVTDAAQVSLDKTPPTISASADREANGAGWYSDDVIVSFACADSGGSGVLAGSCPGSIRLGEGADQSARGSVSDAAGNEASAGVNGINVDKTAPTIAGAPTTEPNGDGWYTGDVSVAWTCHDNEGGSGLAADCPEPSTVEGEGRGLGASASIHDRAGNEGTGSVGKIDIDRTAPSTHAVLPETVAGSGGWYAGPITVALSGDDPLSGIAATYYAVDGGERQTYEGPFPFDRSGSHTIRFWSADKAGNVEDRAADGHEVTIRIDTDRPSINGSRDMEANADGWNNTPVTVSFDCHDADSGIDPAGGCTAPVKLETEGAAQSVKGTAKDLVGNEATATVSGINIDLTAPVVKGAATQAANAAGWHRGDVTVHWTCSDDLSGVKDGVCPEDSTVTDEGANLSAGPVSAQDAAGNTGTGTVDGINIDRTAPTVGFTAPAAGATVSTDSVAVSVVASDELSKLDSVSINGAAATQNADGGFSRTVSLACGPNTITAAAVDNAGNRAEVTRAITRSCLWVGGALAPIAVTGGAQTNPAAANLQAVKIKSVVPVKFKLYRDQARTQVVTEPPAGSSARLTVVKYDATTDSTDTADVLSAGSANTDSLFRWTGSPDYQYVYNLATTGKTAGTYGLYLTLYASDGSVLAKSATQYLVLRA